MFRQCAFSLKVVGFIFGFVSYIISASPLPVFHKIGLFMMLSVLTSLFALAISELNDYEDI